MVSLKSVWVGGWVQSTSTKYQIGESNGPFPKDLAAECAKAYELMESSLSKLTNDFSIGPFGLTPKTKVSDFLIQIDNM